tara:strand:+ start:3856 stop:3993 length:138 start_codon:yes stop_codon:yes gene_type:complete
MGLFLGGSVELIFNTFDSKSKDKLVIFMHKCKKTLYKGKAIIQGR